MAQVEPTSAPTIDIETDGPPPPPSDARTVEDFDTTTIAERQAAASGPAGGMLLGLAVVSLGDAAQPGFWVETPLVGAATQGRVVHQGKSVAVELRPGGANRASLAVLRLLQVPLTDLTEVSLYAG